MGSLFADLITGCLDLVFGHVGEELVELVAARLQRFQNKCSLLLCVHRGAGASKATLVQDTELQNARFLCPVVAEVQEIWIGSL